MPDTKISALPAAASFLAADQIPVNEGGTTKRVTGTQLQTFLATTALAAPLQYAPSNPTGTTSLVGVMMGLNNGITPIGTGRLLIMISGTVKNVTAIADGAQIQIRQGGGANPANGAAMSGTAAGGLQRFVASTTAEEVPFALQAVVTGFTLGVVIWIDISLAAINAGTASVTNISMTVIEF